MNEIILHMYKKFICDKFYCLLMKQKKKKQNLQLGLYYIE